MVIGIFGESCTGKSTLAEKLAVKHNAVVFTGKDYLRLAKNEAIAKKLFQKKLAEAVTGENLIYVIAEKPLLDLLPEGCIRILVTADLNTIKERFAVRMRGTLPLPVASMVERNHGVFDAVPHDHHVISGVTDVDALIKSIK